MAKTRPDKAIAPTNPKVVPGVAEKTFDGVRVKRMVLAAGDPNKAATLRSTLCYYRDPLGDGVLEDDDVAFPLVVPDVYDVAEYDATQVADLSILLDGATLEQEIVLVVSAVQHIAERYGKATGKI
jgi:hypothetical protein